MNKRMLRKKLALMLATLKKKRKYYCECEYLESTGTQYINTGLLSTANSKVDCVFGFSSMESGAANNCAVFGGRGGTTTNTFTFFKLASTTPQYFRFDYNGQERVGTSSQLTWNTTSKYRIEYNGTNYIATNITTGESVTTPKSPASTFTSYPICLFAVNSLGTIGQHLSGRIYKYWYTDGTNTIDLIPVLDWNMTPCMYDKVSGQLFYNQGTGSFVAGRQIHPVEYLESTGAQYINTGIVPTSSMNAKIDFYIPSTSLNTEQHILGAMAGSGATNGGRYQFLGFLRNSNKWRTAYGQLDGDINNWGTAIYEEKVHFDVTLQNGTSTVYINNNTTPDWTYTDEEDVVTPSSIYLFALNNGGSTALPASCRIYSCSISHDGTLLRDFIPAIDENGVGFMFDRVTHTIYDNAGTGAFNYPPVELEYIQYSNRNLPSVLEIPLFYFDEVDKIEYTFLSNSNVTADIFLGSKVSTTGWIGFGGSTNVRFQDYGGHYVTTTTLPVDADNTLKGNGIKQTWTFTYNKTEVIHTSNKAGIGGYDPSEFCKEKKIYSIKAYSSDVLSYDFVPAYQNGVVGMLDKVSGVFFSNQGTGAFTAGAIVEPEYE